MHCVARMNLKKKAEVAVSRSPGPNRKTAVHRLLVSRRGRSLSQARVTYGRNDFSKIFFVGGGRK